MNEQERWTLIQETMRAFAPHYQEAVRVIFNEDGFQNGDWYVCFLAYGREGQPITAAFIKNKLNPYPHIDTLQGLLDGAMERGFLQGGAEQGYTLTNAGRESMVRFFRNARQLLASIEPLPAEKMARLAVLLGKIIEVTEAAPVPAAKTGFRLSRRTTPDDGDAAPAVLIDQYLTDLLRYRDDAHIASWRDLDVSGQAWQTFTAIWREEATTPAALYEHLANAHSQHGPETYVPLIEELIGLGWVETVRDEYQVTEKGRALREEAEAVTNRHFFTGWSALNPAETAELDTLLADLRDQLRALAADCVMATAGEAHKAANSNGGAIFKLTRDAVVPALEEIDLAVPGLPFGLMQAASFDPEPISSPLIQKRFPYGAPAIWDGRLAALAERGLLTPAGEGGYLLTDNGRSALNHFLAAFRNKLDQLAEPIETDLERLATLLGRVIDASLNAPQPPGAWALRHSHALYPGDEAPSLARIDHYLDDLNAFRDDAHLAAFAHHDIDGHAWEFFTMLWRGEVKDAAAMAEEREFRGYDQDDYAAALDDLMARGWVQATNGGYGLTVDGVVVREKAETATDRYFYLPWANLSRADLVELSDLLSELDTTLSKMTTAVPA